MQIQDYKAGDEKKILELFHAVFNKPMNPAYWKWRFVDNPVNKVMIKLMWDGDILAGHYAVSPVAMKVEGKDSLSALSMTTMTHPDYGGKGIFSDLAESLYQEEFRRSNLSAIWGFPNNNSHYGFIKNLKWKNLEQIPTLVISPANVRDELSDNINLISAFNESNISAFCEVTSDYRVKVKKTKEYLDWRYFRNPDNEYSVFSLTKDGIDYFAVTKLFLGEKSSEIDIVELIFPADLKSLSILLAAIKKKYSSYNPSQINCWLPLNDTRHILLEKLGFANHLPVTYSGIRLMDEGLSIMENPANWYYSMGDSDIY